MRHKVSALGVDMIGEANLSAAVNVRVSCTVSVPVSRSLCGTYDTVPYESLVA